MPTTRFSDVCYVAFLAPCLSLYGHAQSSVPAVSTQSITSTSAGIRFEAVGGRPLENIVKALDEVHGWVVDYEDAPFEGASYFEDTATGQSRLDHGGKGWLSLKSRPFSFESQYRLDHNGDSAAGILSQFVDRYNNSGNPDTLKLLQEGPGRFSIVGTTGSDDFGTMISRKSILDIPIKLPPGRQTLLDAVTNLTEQVTRESRMKVVIGTIPANLLSNNVYTQPADMRLAREQLAAILDAAPIKLVWFLLYDRNVDFYALNLTIVTHYVKDNHGDNMLAYVANK